MSYPVRRSAAAGSLMFLGAASAQPDRHWLDRFGTAAHDEARALAADGAGGAYIAGYTLGDLGGLTAGAVDAFVARYDVAGQRAWIVQFGTAADDYAASALPDGTGGVFIAGMTGGSLGGPNAGGGDGFIARYDGTGHEVWTTQFGSAGHEDAYELAPDGEGGVYVAGDSWGDLAAPNAGQADVFVARFDGSGRQLWVKQFGTAGTEYADGLATDNAGGVFVTGPTNGSLGAESAGQEDVFLARFAGGGDQLWLKQFGSEGYDLARAAAPDSAGGVFIAGYTDGDLGGLNAGVTDVFIARFDSSGDRAWLTQLGTPGTDYAQALVPDGAGGMFFAGYTGGDLGGPNAGMDDAFLGRCDSAGNSLWLAQLGTDRTDTATALASAGAGRVYVAGFTEGDLGGVGQGDADVYLAQYGPACYADCDTNGSLDLFDFLCFIGSFVVGYDEADCDQSGTLDLFDFLCFTNDFNGGCG